MIKFSIRGENIEVTDALREYTENRISHLEKYFKENYEMTAHINLKIYKNKTGKVEVTIPAKQVTLRAEDTSKDLYGSIDKVQEKLSRQIRKYKTKINEKHGHTPTGQNPEFSDLTEEDKIDSEETQIIRTKHVELKPMSADEAALQMEMLGHDFYFFTESESSNPAIVYRRKDGGVGLIEG